MDVKNSLTYLFTQVSNNFRNQLQKQMNTIGLHSGQVFILFSLWETDGQSQIELVKNLNLTAPTINKMVNSLLKNGFVKCEKWEKDGRMLKVFLTEKGLQSKESVDELILNSEQNFFAVLNETEKLILAQILGKLKDGFV
jgi:DNA-binding MarR family transcriptional regulator